MSYCVVVLDGRQPICVLRLVCRNSHTEHFSIFLWEFSIMSKTVPQETKISESQNGKTQKIARDAGRQESDRRLVCPFLLVSGPFRSLAPYGQRMGQKTAPDQPKPLGQKQVSLPADLFFADCGQSLRCIHHKTTLSILFFPQSPAPRLLPRRWAFFPNRDNLCTRRDRMNRKHCNQICPML